MFLKTNAMKHFAEIHELYYRKTLLHSQKDISDVVLSVLSTTAYVLDDFHRIINVFYTLRRF